MDPSTMMKRLAEVLDAHAWDALPALLHEDLVCRLVHTGEVLDREAWVRLNAEYPGFEGLVLQDCIADATRAAGRSHVTGRRGDEIAHFEVATFITLRDGRISEMTEVWADVGSTAPEGSRPA